MVFRMVAEPSRAGAPGAEGAAAHPAPAGHGDAPAYAPPNPRVEAQRMLEEGRDLLAAALEALQGGGNATGASDLVGRASDRVGSALHYLRQVTRR